MESIDDNGATWIGTTGMDWDTDTRVQADDLFSWTDYDNRAYFKRILRKLHNQRFVEFNQDTGEVELLPPGYDVVVKLLYKLS